ncbi:hypothetical protein NPIL_396671 [Nephila pilipes]|uniref:Uncharacterized protein n=1 Tax=Nephila pilipes TaxID=299642 RepID=A0A8X6N099_NEPPI|nr:hypothetical protein NPIL_396671 [Nephila pilipes]
MTGWNNTIGPKLEAVKGPSALNKGLLDVRLSHAIHMLTVSCSYPITSHGCHYSDARSLQQKLINHITHPLCQTRGGERQLWDSLDAWTAGMRTGWDKPWREGEKKKCREKK